ncbi:MAG: 3-isopropylmalate dehydratase large subunit [Hadesarchaea archaeon]|nr:3-isopropylmalate dehydratase large subunit [Hadesarchaea archaeon]
MGMTIAEKILARASGRKQVSPGEIVEGSIDVAMTHDIEGPMVVEGLRELGTKKVWDPSKIVVVFDHQVPANSIDAALNHVMLREFAIEQKIPDFYDVFEGICHAVLPEKGFALPGRLIVGTDSHTTTYGAFGCFATGIGSTDMVAVFTRGELWFRVPESVRMTIEGRLPKRVMSKDLILKIIGEVGADGETYRSVEFVGAGMRNINMAGRMTMCNMGVEMGAKAAIVPPDGLTTRYLRGRARGSYKPVYTDRDAAYVEERSFDVKKLEPQVARPYSVDNVGPVSEVEGIEIDQAFLGSCTNGRFEDLVEAAKIVNGRKISKRVRMLVVPASREVYLKALERGILAIFARAGALVEAPSCAACMGGHVGILAPGEVCISASNRNFRGRMGSPKGKIYLASPTTVAASALKGKITDPRDL